MIIVALTALLLRFSIEQLLQWNTAQNDANAQETLKLLSTALENYAKDHQGAYPLKLAALSEAKPPYIGRPYAQMGTARGYRFECSALDAGGYSCSAVPVRCRITGNAKYRVTTGGSMTIDVCNPKE